MKKIILVFLLLIGFNAYGNEKECLAENVYFEARGQGQAGWVAVAQVTLNRVQDKRFPNTICEVVKQGLTYESGFPIKNKCFTYAALATSIACCQELCPHPL